MKTVRNAFPIVLLALAACADREKPPQTPDQAGYSSEQGPSTDTSGNQSMTPGGTSSIGDQPGQPASPGTTMNNNDGRGYPGATGNNGTTGMSGDTRGGATPSENPGDTTALGDEQILQVLHYANVGEIDQARLALRKSKDPKVKQFAQMMINDHGAADAKGAQVGKRLRLTLSDSTLASTLQSDSRQTLDQLQSDSASFDKSYIDAQIKMHQTVLDAIDRRLLPGAKQADVRDLLQAVRPKIADHLKQAQDIQSSLASGPSSSSR